MCRRCRADARWLEAQLDDLDIGPVLEWLEASVKRPSWEEVATTSPATKHYWEQWDTLRLVRGVLVKK